MFKLIGHLANQLLSYANTLYEYYQFTTHNL